MRKKRTKSEITAAIVAAGVERKQLSFPDWCASRGFSESMGRNMCRAGVGPEKFQVGRLVFVTVEADAKWFAMWEKGGKEKFKAWQREQREKRAQRELPQQPQAGV